jgi:tetratricopeptide (TPR) repeat protein
MLTTRGTVKILDFGVAKVVTDQGNVNHEGETESILTNAGVIIGTVPYMSPEQVRGEPVDARSDMFSFGIVVYEMFTQHRPFVKNTTAEIISAILTTDPPPFANFSVRVLTEIEATVRKCLEKERSNRYTTMTEVTTHIENVRRAYEKGELVTSVLNDSHPAHTLERNSSFLTTRSLLTLGVIILLLAAGSVVGVLVRNRNVSKLGATSVNSVAYDYYLRGRVNAGSENRENIEDAIKLLEQAVASDPNLAPAHAELARAYNTKSMYFASDSERKELSVDAEVEVEKALTLNPDLPEGHLARAVVLWTSDNRFPHEQSIQSLKKAIELNPNLGEAHNRLGVIYFHIGLLDKAWSEITKALEINPANTNTRFRLGVIKIYQGKYEDALALFKNIPREANPALVDRNIATALFQLGRTDEASTVVEEYLKDYPTDEGGNVTSVKAMLLAKAGKEREAEETIQRAAQIGKGFVHFHHTAYNLGSAYALLNKPEEAMKWLQIAIDDGFPCFPFFDIDSNLNSLRKDPRFISMMAKLKQQWEKYNQTL